MNAVTEFIAIVSLLLALAAGGGTAKPQAGTTAPQSGGNCPPFACGSDGNHNETLVRDAPPVN
jgi:hypothetical protein